MLVCVPCCSVGQFREKDNAGGARRPPDEAENPPRRVAPVGQEVSQGDEVVTSKHMTEFLHRSTVYPLVRQLRSLRHELEVDPAAMGAAERRDRGW